MMRGLESELESCGFPRIAGVDEAGRGALAGPVVAAAVIPDPGALVPGVDDSKALSEGRREALAGWIERTALATSVGIVSAADIDRSNIAAATRLAMRRALAGLSVAPSWVLVDAVVLPNLGVPSTVVVKGDRISYAIAAASIIAKVTRDRLMRQLDCIAPWYGFAEHKGYGAPTHLQALQRLGPCGEHRLTFRGVVPATRAA